MNSFYMICFDVSDPRRLRRVSNELENFGQRVQRSLFECWLTSSQLFELKTRLAHFIDTENDQIRYYSLCGHDLVDVQIDGSGKIAADIDYTII